MTMLIGQLLYLAVTLAAIAALAVSFTRYGRTLLGEVGDAPESAAATSSAMAGVVLLVDVGVVLWLLSSAETVSDPVTAVDVFAMQIGLALLLLGLIHLVHFSALVGIRNGRRDREIAAVRRDLAVAQRPVWPQPAPPTAPRQTYPGR